MSVPCPRCARPNHERLKSCLYCGEKLPPHEPSPEGEPALGQARTPGAPVPTEADPLAALEPRPPAPETHLLVLEPSPGRAGETDLVAAVAAELDLDAFHLRQKLLSPSPHVVRRGTNREELEALRHWLAEHRIECSVLALSEVRGGPPPFLARGLDPARARAEGFAFLDAGGAREEVAFLSVDAIVVGEVSVRRSGEERRTEARVALRDSVPGIEDLAIARSEWRIADIHRPSGLPIVRIRVPEFDFSGLGPAKSRSSVVNWKGLLDRFRAANPSLVVDESFKLLAPLILAFHDEEGAYYSNEDQFDLFSRIVALHRRRVLSP